MVLIGLCVLLLNKKIFKDCQCERRAGKRRLLKQLRKHCKEVHTVLLNFKKNLCRHFTSLQSVHYNVTVELIKLKINIDYLSIITK